MRSKVKVPDEIFDKKNVVGHSGYTHDINGDEIVQVYVVQKEHESQLADEDLIEKEIEGIETKVFDLGSEPSIFSGLKEPGIQGKLKYLIPGCSVGNYDITAGSLGWFMKKKNKEFLTSNAHVFVDYPHRLKAIETRIIHPGKLDGGNINDYIASYTYHYKISPTVPILNYPLSWWENFKLNRGWLKKPIVPDGWKIPVNYLDFATARNIHLIPIKYETLSFPVSYHYDLVGRIFAGTIMVSLATKIGYELAEGYEPMYVDVADIKQFDKLRKGISRTTGESEGIVLDPSATIVVNYGYFKAKFEDIIMTTKISKGGDSGTPLWKKIEGL